MKTYNEILNASKIDTDDLFEILKRDSELIGISGEIIYEKYTLNLDEINKRLREIKENKMEDQYNMYALCKFITEPNNEYLLNLLDLAPYSVYSIYFADHMYDSIYNEELINEVLDKDSRNFVYLRRINFEPNIQMLLAKRLGKNYIGLCRGQTIESQLVAFDSLSYDEKLAKMYEFQIYNDIIFKEKYEICDLLNEEFLSIVIKTAYIMKTKQMYNSLYPVQSSKFLDYYKDIDNDLIKRCIFEMSISDDGDIIGRDMLPF